MFLCSVLYTGSFFIILESNNSKNDVCYSWKQILEIFYYEKKTFNDACKYLWMKIYVGPLQNDLYIIGVSTKRIYECGSLYKVSHLSQICYFR